MSNIGLLQTMRTINSMARYGRNYQNVINSLNTIVNQNRLRTNSSYRRQYNIIKKGLNSIREELKKENNRLNEMRAAMVLRRRHGKAATTIQRHYRGRIVRKGIHVKSPYTFVVNPNGNGMLAIRNRRLWLHPETFPQMGRPFGQLWKLVDRVVITHRPVALATNWTEVINVERATFAFRHVVSYFKRKWRHDVLTPCHVTFMFEVLISAIKNPYLFT